MRDPSDVIEAGVRGEIYARARFKELIRLPAAKLRREIEADPAAWTVSMARHVLDYLDDRSYSVPPLDALELAHAARIAATRANAQAHVMCRVWKEIANVQRDLGRFPAAAGALECADAYAADTFTPWLHFGLVEMGRMALCADVDRYIDARTHAATAVAAFEDNGAFDRAARVREYLATIAFNERQYEDALRGFREALESATARGNSRDRARNLSNVAYCYVRMDDLDAAMAHFTEAEALLLDLDMIVLAAKTKRARARIAVRVHGEHEWPAMHAAKENFLALGMAGEVCRTTVAVMEEMIRRDPDYDISDLCREIAADALSLGIWPLHADMIARLREANAQRIVTEELLQEAWEDFGTRLGTAPEQIAPN